MTEPWKKRLLMYNTVQEGFVTQTDKMNFAELLSRKEKFISSIFKPENLAQRSSNTQTMKPQQNYKVLSSSMTELVGCFVSTSL
jgi:hypothetical protein